MNSILKMKIKQQCGVKSVQGKWILLATILASGMAFLIGTAISVALPTIQKNLDTTITGIQWIVNAYVLTLAVLILISGSLGDHFGRKRIFSYGIFVFVIGSLLSGLSDTISKLIASQAILGIGAAMMIPGSLALINACFLEKQKGRAIGLWAGISAGMASVGPFLGGWLVETFSWQSIFFINIPFGILTLFITYKFVPESKNPEARKLDWLGTIFIGLGLFGISFGLIQGPAKGWNSQSVLVNLIFGITSFIIFILIETRIKEPMVPFKIFKNPLITGANLATFFLYFALNGTIFFLVLNFQQIQGYSPTLAGLGLLPPIILITFLSGPAGSLADKIGPRLQMILGPLIVSIGMALLIIPSVNVNYFTSFMPGLILFGIGMAIVIAPLTKSALAVEQKFSGLASGINNAVSRIAALMAIAILGGIVISLFTTQLDKTINASTLNDEEKNQILSQSNKLGGIEIPSTFDSNARIITKNAVNESFIYGFRWAMGVSALLALLSTIISIFTIRNPKPEK